MNATRQMRKHKVLPIRNAISKELEVAEILYFRHPPYPNYP